MSTECLVCGFPCKKVQHVFDYDRYVVVCDICGGTFHIEDDAAQYLTQLPQGKNIRYKVSSFIQKKILHEKSKLYIFNDRSKADSKLKCVYEIKEIIDQFPEPGNDILDQILLNLFKVNPKPGHVIKILLEQLNMSKPVPLLFAEDYREARFYLDALKDVGLISYDDISNDIWKIRIQPAGYNRIAELQRKAPSLSKDVFVALDFECGESYEKAIKPISFRFRV